MSVPTWRREESGIQYLDNARELEKYTLKQCVNFPKRYMFFITQHLVNLAQSIYDNAKRGNSLDPKDNVAMRDLRLSYFANAMCDVQALNSQLDIAHDTIECFTVVKDGKTKTVPISASVWTGWTERTDKEFQLLKGAYNAFYEKYRASLVS